VAKEVWVVNDTRVERVESFAKYREQQQANLVKVIAATKR
jgi:hypothetical protein